MISFQDINIAGELVRLGHAVFTYSHDLNDVGGSSHEREVAADDADWDEDDEVKGLTEIKLESTSDDPVGAAN